MGKTYWIQPIGWTTKNGKEIFNFRLHLNEMQPVDFSTKEKNLSFVESKLIGWENISKSIGVDSLNLRPCNVAYQNEKKIDFSVFL